jgi:hypothetical protein
LGNNGSAADQQEVARYGFVVFSSYGTPSDRQAVISTMRKANPSVKLAAYTQVMELAPSADPSDTNRYPALQAVNANGWWLRTAAGQRIQWNDSYDTYLVNYTRWAPRDASGKRWSDWLAHQQAGLLGGLSGLDYVYVDNVLWRPKASADWKRNGTNQDLNDPEIMSETRAGMANYWNTLRSLMPGKKIIGNTLMPRDGLILVKQ